MALRMIEGFSFVLSNEEGRATYKYPFSSYHSLIAHTGGQPNDFVKGATTGLGIPARMPLLDESGNVKPSYVGYLSRPLNEVGFIDTKHFGPQKTWIVGEAIYFSGIIPSPGPSSLLLSFYSPSGIQGGIGVDTGGHVYGWRGSGEHLISSTLAMQTGLWYYVETKIYTDNSFGSMEVRVNEFPWFKIQNIDLKYAATDEVSLIRFHAPRHFFIDDIYVCDGSGSTNNDFLGDCIVDYLVPKATGRLSTWIQAQGVEGDKPFLLDEHDLKIVEGNIAPNLDYVYGSSYINENLNAVKAQDSYIMSPLHATGYSIVGLDVHSYSKDQDVTKSTYAKHLLSSSAFPSTGNGVRSWPIWKMDNWGAFHELDYTYGVDTNVRETGITLHGGNTIMIRNRGIDESPDPPFTTGNLPLVQFGFMID